MVSLADEVEVPSDEESTSSGHSKNSSNDSDPYDSFEESLPQEFLQFAFSYWGSSDSKKARLSHRPKESGSSQAEEIFQQVKAAPLVENSEVPPTLDDPKLEEKKGKVTKDETYLVSQIRLSKKTDESGKPSKRKKGKESTSDQDEIKAKLNPKRRRSIKKTAVSSSDDDSEDSDVQVLNQKSEAKNLKEKKDKVMQQKKTHLLSKIRLSEKTDSETVSSDDEDGSGSVVLFSKPKSKKPLSARKQSPIYPLKKAGKEKKTLRASHQQIGTANSRGCLLAKELARLSELDRQQPPPSSSNKMIKDPPSRKKKSLLPPRGSQKGSIPPFSDGPTASSSGSDLQTETESENPKKRRKGKQSPSDKDDGESESKKKRRRSIKKTAVALSDGDSEDSDVQVLIKSKKSEAGASKRRKNIKKIMKDENLKEETKAATKEEEARRERILERQKIYNKAFDGDLAIMNAQIDHLVLDFDPETNEELVTVNKDIVKQLKPHQVEGVKFMWDACFESVERLKTHPGSGCILAHCMGLGKSLQVVTLAHTVLTHDVCQVKQVLVVGPLSTVLNWVNEFERWLPDDLALKVYELVTTKTMKLRANTLRNWMASGGVLVMGYAMYRSLCNETNKTNKKIPKEIRETFRSALVNPGPDLVVCDEGHILKNEASALSKTMDSIRTQRRIVLTGTPLQNNLDEYHCMVQLVKPNLLGTKNEFLNRFANPIKNGQAADSTALDVRVMKLRAHVLHKMLEAAVQRYDYSVLSPFLPPKHEFVIYVRMSDVQIKMYQHYLDNYAKGGPSNAGMRGKGAGLFADFQELGRVWTHPKALLLAQINRDEKDKDKKAIARSDEGDRNKSIFDDRSSAASDEEVSSDESGSEEESGRGDAPPPEGELGDTAPINATWWSSFVTHDDMDKIEHSGKLVLLMDILRQCELIGDKVLVFSQSLVSLDLIEEFLVLEGKKNEEARAALSQASSEKIEQAVTWRKNADYFRLDGSTNTDLRNSWTKSFNNPENLRSRLFLISTKAGGLGINLTAANRVIIFDASWNPSHDVQSIFRVYRFGQLKPCYVYRFLAQGTMEEKIYDRQVTKLSLSCRVVDEQQIERHFNSADLNELYIFEADSHLRRPTPMVPKDRLLAELTILRKDWIVTHHEHDSLLENQMDEGLSKEERQAAWVQFEESKNSVPDIGTDHNKKESKVSKGKGAKKNAALVEEFGRRLTAAKERLQRQKEAIANGELIMAPRKVRGKWL